MDIPTLTKEERELAGKLGISPGDLLSHIRAHGRAGVDPRDLEALTVEHGPLVEIMSSGVGLFDAADALEADRQFCREHGIPFEDFLQYGEHLGPES